MLTSSSAHLPGFQGLPKRLDTPWAWSGSPVFSCGAAERAVRTRSHLGGEERSARSGASWDETVEARADAGSDGRPQLVPDGAEAAGPAAAGRAGAASAGGADGRPQAGPDGVLGFGLADVTGPLLTVLAGPQYAGATAAGSGDIARLRYGISLRREPLTRCYLSAMRVRQWISLGIFAIAAVGAIGAWSTPQYWSPYPAYDRGSDFLPIMAGFGLFFGSWWWLRSGRAGDDGLAYVDTLPVALALPVLVVPVVRYGHSVENLLAAILVAAAMLPIGFQFVSQISERRSRLLVALAVLGFAFLASVEGLAIPRSPIGVYAGNFWLLWVSSLAAVTLVPGLVTFISRRQERAAGELEMSFSDLLVELTPILTPAIACLTLWDTSTYFLGPIALWGLLLLGRRIGVERLTMALGRTTRQRDLVVSATERERARIAADIHDYALQDLTMLVRRLDAAGDVENAQATREVAERLRAICGDLRLPVLDDLGVGPALEWLCGRVEQGGHHVSLDRLEDEKRLPADVELVFFRVAQEAINNAVRHGAPPVRVRYRGGGAWAELEVDDCGPGVPPGAAEEAERTGHLGLMSMSQRAEAIQGELSVGRRPGGGTRVLLVWEGAAEPAAPAPTPSVEPSIEPAAEPT